MHSSVSIIQKCNSLTEGLHTRRWLQTTADVDPFIITTINSSSNTFTSRDKSMYWFSGHEFSFKTIIIIINTILAIKGFRNLNRHRLNKEIIDDCSFITSHSFTTNSKKLLSSSSWYDMVFHTGHQTVYWYSIQWKRYRVWDQLFVWTCSHAPFMPNRRFKKTRRTYRVGPCAWLA